AAEDPLRHPGVDRAAHVRVLHHRLPGGDLPPVPGAPDPRGVRLRRLADPHGDEDPREAEGEQAVAPGHAFPGLMAAGDRAARHRPPARAAHPRSLPVPSHAPGSCGRAWRGSRYDSPNVSASSPTSTHAVSCMAEPKLHRSARRWKKSVPSTAVPNAPPSCWTAVSVPEAEPDSCGSTPASTMSKNGAMTSPMPMPASARPGANRRVETSVPVR